MRLQSRFFKNGVIAGSVALLCGLAAAQTQENPAERNTAAPVVAPGQSGQAAVSVPETPAESSKALSFIDQDHVEMDQSFDWEKRLELIQAQRQAALSNTQFKAEFRTMYMDQNRYDGSEREAWAAGLAFGMKTGYFLDRIAFGATLYTSQPIYAPDDKGGTRMLNPSQDGYTVLGEIYGDIRITDDVHAYIGRKAYDTPYINRNDTRMTPNTFEAAVLQGKVNLGASTNSKSSFNYGLGYFDSIKERDQEDFESMSKAVKGATVERGVYTAGGNYKNGDFSIGGIDYFCPDTLNIAYTETKCAIQLTDDLKLKLAAQYSYQDNDVVGDTADQVGVKAELPVGRATFTVAGTATGSGADMTSPWGGYPGYTSVQVEDFNRAGEDALLLRASYDFSCIQGLSAYVLAVTGTDPDASGEYARNEYDSNLQWKASEGLLKGLTLRLRYAVVTQDGRNGDDLTDFRVMCYYDLAELLKPINP